MCSSRALRNFCCELFRQQDFSGHAGNERAVGIVDLKLQANGLDVALAPTDVALGGEVALDGLEDDSALDRLARGQSHLELVSLCDEAGFGFGSFGADPGIAEIDDG